MYARETKPSQATMTTDVKRRRWARLHLMTNAILQFRGAESSSLPIRVLILRRK
jgi:hypothetical protein